jgi:arginase
MFMGTFYARRSAARRAFAAAPLPCGQRVYTSVMPPGKVAVFGVPSSAGASAPGLEHAPFVLREAGLLQALSAEGATVVNLSDLSLFPFRQDADHPRARNVSGVACAVRAAGDETTRALAEGFTVVLGGDCTLAVGTVAGARDALGSAVGLIYMDANADLNTPDTSPSGLLCGMALAMAMGRGPSEVATAAGEPPAVRGEHVALLGYRQLDGSERRALGHLGLALPAEAMKRLGMRVAAALALDAVENDDGPIVVHLDVDVIDPQEMPAKASVTPGTGLTMLEAADLVTALVASPRVVALEVVEYLPDRDADRSCARALVSLIARAVARRLRTGR